MYVEIARDNDVYYEISNILKFNCNKIVLYRTLTLFVASYFLFVWRKLFTLLQNDFNKKNNVLHGKKGRFVY